MKIIALAAGLAVSVQAAPTATSFDSATLVTTTSQALDGFTVQLDAAVANLITDGAQTFSNSTLTGLVNDGNSFSMDRLRFNPSGNTATWNITDAAAPGTKLYFATIDVDLNGDTALITDGTNPFAFSSLLWAGEYNANTDYTISNNTTGDVGTYDETTGTLYAITSGNTSATAVWDVSDLSQVTWTPSNNNQQAMFFTVTGLGPDTTPPLLSSTDPMDGATNVATNTDLVATFNEGIALTGSGSITIRNLSGGADIPVTLPGDVSIGGAILTITPATSLVAGEEYAVEISSDSIEDLAGNDYAGILATDDPNWSFTADGTAPMSSGTSPMAGATDANPSGSLSLSFDEDVLGVAGKTITIHLSGGGVVDTIDAGSVTIVGGEVIIDPNITLDSGTSYYVNIETGAFVDASGNEFAGISDSTTWSFTTSTPLSAPWVAYHDIAAPAVTGNVTVHYIGAYDAPSLVPGPTTTVGLVSYSSGAATGVAVTVSGARGVDFRSGGIVAAPAVGTPADALFNGITGLDLSQGTINQQANDGDITITLAGLDATLTYDLALYGDRQQFADGAESFILGGADSATNVSSTGIVDIFTTALETRLNGGTGNPGHVVRWTDIEPGADGTVTVTMDPVSGSNNGYINALRLEALAAPESLVLKISQSGGALDFEWNSLPGMQYDLLTSTDLAAPVADWPVYDDGVMLYEAIPATGDNTTLGGVNKTGPVRFFALREEPAPPLFAADFEGGDGGFTTSADAGTAWEWGTPDSSGLGGTVDSGNGADPGTGKCWGTGIGNPGFYADPTTNSRLISPAIDLTNAAGAELSFAHAIDLEPNDSAVVRIFNTDTDEEIVAGDFPLTIGDPDTNEAPWTTSGPHALQVGAPIRIEWILNGTGGGTNDFMGWYVDDVSVVETAAP